MYTKRQSLQANRVSRFYESNAVSSAGADQAWPSAKCHSLHSSAVEEAESNESMSLSQIIKIIEKYISLCNSFP